MKLLLDMNLSPNWVDRLNTAGLPAIHWSSVGRVDATDIEIMAYAAEHAYVVLTHDLDFSAILAATRAAPDSICCHFAPANHETFSTNRAIVIATATALREPRYGGGGGPGYSRSSYAASGEQTVKYTVGVAGSGGTAGNNGTAGTASTISSGTLSVTTMTTNGGALGAAASGSTPGAGGTGGTASGGNQANTTGGAGGAGNNVSGGTGAGGTAPAGVNGSGNVGGVGGFQFNGGQNGAGPGKAVFYYT